MAEDISAGGLAKRNGAAIAQRGATRRTGAERVFARALSTSSALSEAAAPACTREGRGEGPRVESPRQARPGAKSVDRNDRWCSHLAIHHFSLSAKPPSLDFLRPENV